MVLFWTLLILLAIGETNWQWDLGTVFGIIFVTCVLLSWIAFFIRTNPAKTKEKEKEVDDDIT
jgi:hypothetical protein